MIFLREKYTIELPKLKTEEMGSRKKTSHELTPN